MVADKVSVHSRAWHADSPELVWTSDGKSGYEIEETSGLDRGSKLVLHLKEDCAEYATEARVKHLIEPTATSSASRSCSTASASTRSRRCG
jgi:TNF receptor-associated protein 1